MRSLPTNHKYRNIECPPRQADYLSLGLCKETVKKSRGAFSCSLPRASVGKHKPVWIIGLGNYPAGLTDGPRAIAF